MTKPVVTIESERFSDLEGFFEEVSRSLIPGASWGHNLDAFNDILRGGFGTPDEGDGFVLRWEASDLSQERLGYAETIRQLERRLERCHFSNKPEVAEQLDAARRSKGATVFDWLVAIIEEHEDIDLELVAGAV
jgi:RNAse (barnase) inhibitor barstar